MNLFRPNPQKILPTQITIDISGVCNANCSFCLRQLTDDVPTSFMAREMFYEIMKQVRKIQSIKVISLSAYGEALLHPNFDEFVEYLHKLKYRILVITNMSVVNKHYESLLKTHFLIMSVEGHNKETYEKYRKGLNFGQVEHNIIEFDKIVREARLYKEHTPSRMINCLLTKGTNLNKFKEKWAQYTDIIKINYMVNPISWNQTSKKFDNLENADLEEEIINKNNRSERTMCKEPFKTIVVHPNGKLALCCNDANCSFDFGSYKEIKKSFYYNKNLNMIRKELLDRTPFICENCSVNVMMEDSLKN